MNKGDYPNLTQKTLLLDFWKRFGGKNSKGVGFTHHEKLKALRELAAVVIVYKNQTPLIQRREQFNETKTTLHPFRRFGACFVCERRADGRHHLIQLQHGGINSRKNLVSLCDPCHAEIHPWLK